MPEHILEYVKSADELPSAPGVAMRIVELNQQEDVDVAELAELLSQDPALVAKVLRTANSGMFGMPREVSSVRQAVMILGLRTVNLLALSFSSVSISSGDAHAFDYRGYWTQSAASALGARVLAQKVWPELRDEAFLGGMLCDIGRLVLAEKFPDEYAPVCARLVRSADPVPHIERELLGTDHMEVGEVMLRGWQLPDVVCEAVGSHHAPASDAAGNPGQTLARVLHLSSLCGEMLSGLDLASHAAEIRRVGEEYFGMKWEDCESFLEDVGNRVPEAAQALQLDAADAASIAEIRAQATHLMVKASLQLEQQVHDVTTQVATLEAENTELQRQAVTDGLTGLRNRRSFDESIASELERARELGAIVGLLLVDLDHFKSVNDDHGHQVGDDLLRAAAQAIQADSRGAIACRYGGEEFALICPNDDEAALAARAERLRAALAAVEIRTEAGVLSRTASLGGCSAAGEALSGGPEAIIARADAELYRAKEDGRDRAYVCTLDP